MFSTTTSLIGEVPGTSVLPAGSHVTFKGKLPSLSRWPCFNSLVLPILSCASEVWAVEPKLGEAAEKLRRQFLK